MTCGYVCPQCEGSDVMDNGETCDWCQPVSIPKPTPTREDNIFDKDLGSAKTKTNLKND